MQRLYLALAIVGFAIPVWFLPSTIQNGNLFLMLNPTETLELTFASYASAAFTADLLWVFVVFCTWVVLESRSRGLRHAWAFVALALFFGVSGPLPLFLYHRERATVKASAGGRLQAP